MELTTAEDSDGDGDEDIAWARVSRYAPEMLLDENNPANDRYYQSLNGARAIVVHLSRRMRPRHVQVVRRAYAGTPNAQIARELRYTPVTVANILKREDARELLDALRFVGHLVDGPNIELKRNMLWRIAQRSEENEPNVAITALKELNKLAGEYPQPQETQQPTVNVVINQEMFPRTALDEGDK